jgi:hypothetical protein
MHMQRIFGLLSLCALVVSAGSAAALEPSFIVQNLPRQFIGTFQWHDGNASEVSISLSDVSAEAKGIVTAEGKGEYRDDAGFTRIEVECVIDAASLRFEMFERASLDGFVAGGSHVGRISEDLRTVTATWTTRSTGAQGTLTLQAE